MGYARMSKECSRRRNLLRAELTQLTDQAFALARRGYSTRRAQIAVGATS